MNMEYYNTISPAYNELHSAEQLEKAAIIKKNCRMHGLFLDIGAGTGIATKEFEKYAKCIALDPSIEMLKQYNGLKVVARAEQLPFKSHSFDSILSITALHHADLPPAKKEIERVAKKGAKIAISFFKRAGNFSQAKSLFSAEKSLGKKVPDGTSLFAGFRTVDSPNDLIFISQ